MKAKITKKSTPTSIEVKIAARAHWVTFKREYVDLGSVEEFSMETDGVKFLLDKDVFAKYIDYMLNDREINPFNV